MNGGMLVPLTALLQKGKADRTTANSLLCK